jgi:hypothetical protein
VLNNYLCKTEHLNALMCPPQVPFFVDKSGEYHRFHRNKKLHPKCQKVPNSWYQRSIQKPNNIARITKTKL